MKLLLTILIFFFMSGCNSSRVSFVTKLDIANATKDGIYVDGYIVNIPYEKAQELHGKAIRISGKVTTVRGVGDQKNGEIVQGRRDDSKHILDPKIKILNDQP